ncbi:MAG: hypothetical protein KIT22_10895 [Verrucomicrobiae bacterium]|nr:hypothetical protein [Verrucomicrobiae bacterium]
MKYAVMLLGAYLVLAAIGKSLHPMSLYSFLEFDGITSHWRKRAVAMGLILMEALVGLGLIFFPFSRTVSQIALALYSAFILQLVAVKVFNGPNVCGCAGCYALLFPEFKVTPGIIVNTLGCGILGYCLYARRDAKLN